MTRRLLGHALIALALGTIHERSTAMTTTPEPKKSPKEPDPDERKPPYHDPV